MKGVFTGNQFQGQEGNQGPYKLTGPNGELYVLVVSGSETVFVNGIPLERGENKDYLIDYNAGEIKFNATFLITSEMRITVEYQYADRNYSRVLVTAGGKYSDKKLDLGAFVYSESDLKNQPLQQELSTEQKQILADAGDDTDKMIAPSAVPDTFDENKVPYTKERVNGQEVFVYSNNPDAENLFQVKFTRVGENKGNYILSNASAISRVYEYVAPLQGIPQGNYAPVTQLFAPKKLQMAVINGGYHPTEKTNIDFEVAASKNDENLYSDLDDSNANGFAARMKMRQNLVQFKNKSELNAVGTFNYIQRDFQTVQRLYNVEFNRDWNLVNPFGNQVYADGGLEYTNPDHGVARYRFEHLGYSENFEGNRQALETHLHFGNLRLRANGSSLKSEGESYDSDFIRKPPTGCVKLGWECGFPWKIISKPIH